MTLPNRKERCEEHTSLGETGLCCFENILRIRLLCCMLCSLGKRMGKTNTDLHSGSDKNCFIEGSDKERSLVFHVE